MNRGYPFSGVAGIASPPTVWVEPDEHMGVGYQQRRLMSMPSEASRGDELVGRRDRKFALSYSTRGTVVRWY